MEMMNTLNYEGVAACTRWIRWMAFIIQAAIGSKALDMAREEGDQNLVKFGLDVLTLAVLAILITAPTGALAIGLAGPRLLARQVKG